MPSPVAYEIVDSVAGFHAAAAELSRARGAFALDTERASAYRYDDRAFLVQVTRPGAGVYLLAPEGLREEFTSIFAAVLNDETWILHAAGEDLTSLAWLGLYPGRLFDTELAGRLGGFTRPNLAAMVDEFCGVHLDKGHGREDWSQTPLPAEWAEYAALDVVYLDALATAQAEYLEAAGKLEIAEAEFAYLVSKFADVSAPEPRTWRETKGISGLRSGKSLHIAHQLWEAREAEALCTDTAPGALLSNKALVAIAKELPGSRREVYRIRGVARRFDPWPVLTEAYEDSPAMYPEEQTVYSYPPGKSFWEREHPESWEKLQGVRAAITELGAEVEIPAENLLSPRVLREFMWEVGDTTGRWTTHRVATALAAKGAREWQCGAVAPFIADVLGD